MNKWAIAAKESKREDELDTEDSDPNAELRGETTAQRLDRNYGELLQELRVVQTGVQILFAFLLSLAFYERFSQLTTAQRNFYFANLLVAVVAGALLIAPVAHHRMLFGRRRKDALVAASNRLALLGLCLVMIALAGSVFLIADVLYSRAASITVLGAIILIFTSLWFVMPRLYRDH
jgi:Family of unknown function (DUF6328)